MKYKVRVTYNVYTGNTTPCQALQEYQIAAELFSVNDLLVNEVDGAAGVYIHKIHIDVLIEQLCTAGHGVWKTALQLQHSHIHTHLS